MARCSKCKNELPRVGISGGRKDAALVILGESLGPRAQDGSKPFSADTKVGAFLREVTGKHGVDIDRDCYLVNAVNCDLTGVDEKRKVDTAFDCIGRVYDEIFAYPRKMVIVLGSIAGKVFNEFAHADPETAKTRTITDTQDGGAEGAGETAGAGGEHKRGRVHELTDPKSGHSLLVVYTFHPSAYRNLGEDKIDSETEICAKDIAYALAEYEKLA